MPRILIGTRVPVDFPDSDGTGDGLCARCGVGPSVVSTNAV